MKSSPNNPLKQRAAELGITMVDRDLIPSTRRAHECTEYAREHGKLEPFHAAVLKAYWTEGRDIHDWAVLGDCATVAGLPPVAMRGDVEAGTYQRVVDDRIATAREMGIHSVPTFLIADRYPVQGAQTRDVFEAVFRQLSIEPALKAPAS